MTLQTSYVNVCLQYVSLKNRYPLTLLLEDHCFPISNIINVSIMYPKKYTCSHTCMYAHACAHIHTHTCTDTHTTYSPHLCECGYLCRSQSTDRNLEIFELYFSGRHICGGYIFPSTPSPSSVALTW